MGLTLAEGGKSDYVILVGSTPIPSEEFAAKELREHLARVTGANLEIIHESKLEPIRKAIYVGWTDFATNCGINLTTCGEEEWTIRTVGESLILAGGRPRGTLYAVYEFLEQVVGCHWLGLTGPEPYAQREVIPSRPTLTVGELKVRNKPAFWQRFIYLGMHNTVPELLIHARNKDNRVVPENPPGFAAALGFGHGGLGHAFYSYLRNFPEDKPEYRALDSSGQRPQATSASGPGQICLTNPGAREHVLQQVRQALASEREAAKQAGDGRKISKVVPLSQNDTHWICQCPDCRALSEREQADSGPYLDFINYIADGIRDEYPEVLVEGWAYCNTMKPPKTLRPRDNVSIRVIQLKGEWAIDAVRAGNPNWLPEWYPDYFRPRNHPVNRRATDDVLRKWARICRHLSIWDYWGVYHLQFEIPFVNLRSIRDDLKLYRECRVGSIFVEYAHQNTSFFWLKVWAGWKLMQDPHQDLNKLITTYMDGTYGPAAGKMTEYLNYLEDSIAAVPAEVGNMSRMKTHELPYLTLDFYQTCQRLLDEAEALCPPDSSALQNVEHERIPVDAGLYAMWGLLERQLPAGQTMPWDEETVLERYKNRSGVQDVQGLRDVSESFRETRLPPPVLEVPRLPDDSATGDPSRVDWSKAAPVTGWRTLFGKEAPARKISGAMAHDNNYLYIHLAEDYIDMSAVPKTWNGGSWELFITREAGGVPYRQFAVYAHDQHTAIDFSGGQRTVETGWQVKVDVGDDHWYVLMSIPLKEVVPGGIEAGGSLFMNIIRHGSGLHMCWSPLYGAGYHEMKHLATVKLQ